MKIKDIFSFLGKIRIKTPNTEVHYLNLFKFDIQMIEKDAYNIINRNAGVDRNDNNRPVCDRILWS